MRKDPALPLRIGVDEKRAVGGAVQDWFKIVFTVGRRAVHNHFFGKYNGIESAFVLWAAGALGAVKHVWRYKNGIALL